MSSQNFKVFWDEVIKQIHSEFISSNNPGDFEIWFGRIKYVEDNGTEITVSFPSDFMFNFMNSNGYILKIQTKFKDICGQDISIKPNYEKEIPNTENNLNKKVIPNNNPEEILEEVSTNLSKTENNLNSLIKTEKTHSQLEDKYTFEKFVVGDNSEYAYSASFAAAKEPGKKINPLLLYGGTGLGKTHLMKSIGHYIFNNPPEGKENIKICYISIEPLLNEFTSSIKNGTPEKFKNKYRNLDVLLLDDIQFLRDKRGLQDELFFTFEALFHKNAQMVFTSDRPLSELNGIDERLISRFALGNSIDLQPPSYETRIAILQKKLELQKKSVPQDVIEFIAKNINSNVRELEGCLNKLINYAELLNKPLTIEIAKKQLSDSITQFNDGTVTIDTIQKVISNHYNISLGEIKSDKRSKKLVIPRQIAIYLCRTLTGYSFTEIGQEFGGRDHSTIMYSFEKVEDLLKTDETLNTTIEMLSKEVKEYIPK